MRPVGAPHQPLRRGVDISARQRTRIGIVGWSHFTSVVRSDEFNPGIAGIDEPAYLREQRVVGALRLRDVTKTVKYDWRRQLPQYRQQRRQTGSPDIDLNSQPSGAMRRASGSIIIAVVASLDGAKLK